jgi:hypothetical protein
MKMLLYIILLATAAYVGQEKFTTVKTYNAPEAKQAVVADKHFFYAIDDAAIAKYEIKTGNRVKIWTAADTSHIKHLNSAFIYRDTIYLAHSNYPALPRISSIEKFDTDLNYVGTKNFGQYDGAAGWVVFEKGSWWVLFAHYTGAQAEPGRSSADTRLDKFDVNWNRLASYTFPKQIIEKITPKSISGGAFGKDSYLYCTGHDEPEIYKLKIPETGNELQYISEIEAPCEGQGIAFYNNQLYTIKRSTRQVIVSK